MPLAGGVCNNIPDPHLTTDIFKRFSLNFRSSLQFTGFADNPLQEVIDEINHI